jgi:nucleolar complex protein 2
MVVCLSKCHEEFRYHLLGKGSGKEAVEKKDEKASETEEIDDEAFDENKGIHPKSLSKSRRWADLKLVVQSFLKSTLHLLSEAKEPKLLNFIVKSFAHYIPYLTAYPRIATAMLKALVSLWSAPLDSSEDYQVVRLNAFLRIRQMAVTQPFPFIEQCLRSTYLAYAKRAKFGTAASVTSVLPTLTFMGNCIVELYGLDYQSSYQHAFVYIRQLALHLRTALQKRTPETFRVVYCWQYLHCLKVWVAVLSASAGNSSVGDDEASLLRSLIYPLTEVIFGTARLVPTTRHLPLRLHCVRLIQQLAASAQLYIPTTSILLDVFDLKEVYLKPKRVPSNKGSGGADIKGVRLPLILKLPKEGTLRTTEQLDACLSETFVLLNREVDLYRYSAGFPEFSVWICQRMRKVREFQNTAQIFADL